MSLSIVLYAFVSALLICTAIYYIDLTCRFLSTLLGIYNYLSTVFQNCRNEQQDKEGLSRLESYSRKMKSWYEECTTDYESDDDSVDIKDSENVSKKQDEEQTSQNRSITTTVNVIANTTTSTQTWEEYIPKDNETNPKYSHNWRLGWENNYSYNHPPTNHQLYNRAAIRRIQDNQMSKQVRFLGERDLKAPLIICVEATSTNISGYLLNLKTKVCKFYTYGVNHLPWELDTNPSEWDNTEFKMKNMIFALCLWEHEISQIKKFSVYANCWAVNHPDCEHGKIVTDFIEHFTSCENIIRVNSNPQISRYRDTEVFARLVQPAADLVRWNLVRFRKFIKNMYGITQFEGSHSFLDDYQDASKDDGYFARSYRYNYFLSKVNKNAEKWIKGCRTCGMRLSKSMHYKARDELSSDVEETLFPDIIPYPLSDGCW